MNKVQSENEFEGLGNNAESTDIQLWNFQILNAIDDSSNLIVSVSGEIIFANQCFLLTFGFDSHKLPTRNLDSILHVKKDWLISQIEFCLLHNKTLKKTITLTINFTETPVDMTLYPMTQMKEPTVLIRFKEHNTELNKDYLNLILDPSNDFAAIKDINFRYLSAMGKRYEDVNGKTAGELFGESDTSQINLEEETLKRNDGSQIPTIVRKSPFYDKKNNLIGTANIRRDISILKDIETQLHESENRYQKLVENQNEGLAIIDLNGVFIFNNPAASKIFESDNINLSGRFLRDFLHNESKNSFDQFLGKIKTGQSSKGEFQFFNSGQSTKYILITSIPEKDNKGLSSGAILNIQDITDTKLAEKEFLKSEKKLKEINATKDKFFSIIAHDLKNPFGSIMGFSQMILKKIEEGNLDKIKLWTSYILSASNKGYELLENLLEWSRSQNETLKYSPSKVSLTDLVTHNFQVIQAMAEKKEVALRYKTTEDIWLYIDEDMINTVLRNLLSNAIKFSYRKSKVVIECKLDGNMATIKITDQGIGIRKKDLNKIFSIEQNFTTEGTEKEVGSGLGLVLCKEFVLINKGQISIESKAGKGTTFLIQLPAINS